MTLAIALLVAAGAVSPEAAVASAHPLASEAGAEVLRQGGNAVDAAVATAFAYTVVEQYHSGIGGGGFALVWLAKKRELHAIDFREVAPAAAARDMFVRDGKPDQKLSLNGGLAIGVPGAVKGYAYLSSHFGKKKLSQVIAPSVRLAERGFKLDPVWVDDTEDRLSELAKDPGARKAILRQNADGDFEVPPLGTLWKQPDLARTLRAIAAGGADAFYKGPLAKKLVAGVRAAGGVLTLDDLAKYQVRERTPVVGNYRGYRIASMPPPSSGGALVIGLLQTLEGYDPRAGGYRPEQFIHATIEAEKRLFAIREQSFGDPDFYPAVNAAVQKMISPEFAKALRAQIGERASSAGEIVAQLRESPNTAHISVVDKEGNAVALTTTVNYYWGSCVFPPGTGVAMNDQMDDFAIAPGVANAYGVMGGDANAVAPGKVPLSSMSPTIVFDKDENVRLVVGAAGGSTIITTVAQIIQHFIDDGMRVDQALAAPRFHEQLRTESVRIEPNAFEAATAKALQARGHVLRVVKDPLGNAQAVSLDPKTGLRRGASDPRLVGAPAVP